MTRLRLIDGLGIAAGIAALAVVVWLIETRSYEIWGGYVLLPPLFLLGVLGIRQMFTGDLRPLVPIMIGGLAAKFVGAGFRYWVGFVTYDGVIDAQGYHAYAQGKVAAVRSGELPLSSLVPEGTGTPFLDDVTAVVYFIGGTSRLGGFFLFSFLAFWGVIFFVKAAAIAFPGLALRRYAVLCVLAPSLVYWPSSIGKDAWMVLTLGMATYGIALLFARRGVLGGTLLAGLGLLGAAAVRPHLVVIWLAALIPAMLLGALLPKTRHRLGQAAGTGEVRAGYSSAGQRVMLLGVIVLAVVGLAAAGGATVRYLNPGDEGTATGTDTVTDILDEATRRTSQGSEFVPPNTGNPANWPVAIVRTITRPLLFEANGLAQLIAAAEMTAFLALCALWWRRLANVPRAALTNRYLAFAMGAVALGGLAFASFANLGVLTRQKSILFPFLLLVLCVPPIQRRRRGVEDEPDRAADADRLEDPGEPLVGALVGVGAGTEDPWDRTRAPVSGHTSVWDRPADRRRSRRDPVETDLWAIPDRRRPTVSVWDGGRSDQSPSPMT